MCKVPLLRLTATMREIPGERPDESHVQFKRRLRTQCVSTWRTAQLANEAYLKTELLRQDLSRVEIEVIKTAVRLSQHMLTLYERSFHTA